MHKHTVLRLVTLLLAWAHTFPAIRHIGLFAAEPSLGEAWKGFGGGFAVALYLLPPAWQVRALVALWSRHRGLLVAGGWLLAIAHAVPASDHLPKWLAHPSWVDTWRGFGSAIAILWFVSPLPMQARFLRRFHAATTRLASMPSRVVEPMRRALAMRHIVAVSLGVSVFVAGWGVGCASTGASGSDTTEQGPLGDASVDGAGDDSGGAACTLCVTDKDCNGGVCAQFGSDIYCAPACPKGTECSSDRACTTVSSATGEQVDVCVPRGDVCGVAPGPTTGTDAGGPRPGSDGGGTPPPGNTCGALAGPTVSAHCSSCGSTHTCQPNGCYGGWWCNTQTNKCQAPPTSCTTADAGSAGSDAGVISVDAGGPVTGTIGNSGGSVSRLFFGVVGDTRPASINDTAAYPTQIITQIYTDLGAVAPMPPFVVTTGDYLFSSANGTEAAPQLDL